MIWFLVSGVVLFVIVLFLLKTDAPPLLGVYNQPGKWYGLKSRIFYYVLQHRKRKNAKKTTVQSGEGAGYGMRSRSSPEEMDKVQILPKEHPKAVDAVYFNGGNADGQYMVAATARRHNRLIQTLLYIRLPGVGLLQLPSLPDSGLYSDRDDAFSVAGLHLEVLQPMKKWKLTYKGKMKLVKSDGGTSEEDVEFDVDWNATSAFFDFDTDLDVRAMAESIAREPWTRNYFDRLKSAHQTHYEQYGEMVGPVKVGDKTYNIKVQGIRDHSYGNVREWSDLHRYAIQYCYLEDGTGICVGNICMKPTMTRLIIGYIFHPDGKMETVSWTDLELYKLGEDGMDPTDFNINFMAGEKLYKLTGHVLDRPIFYMGENWDARIHERMCSYTVNGKKGWGISEWQYCYTGGKGNVFQR